MIQINRQRMIIAVSQKGEKMADCNTFCLYGWYCEHFDEFAKGVYTVCEDCEYFSEEENE